MDILGTPWSGKRFVHVYTQYIQFCKNIHLFKSDLYIFQYPLVITGPNNNDNNDNGTWLQSTKMYFHVLQSCDTLFHAGWI